MENELDETGGRDVRSELVPEADARFSAVGMLPARKSTSEFRFRQSHFFTIRSFTSLFRSEKSRTHPFSGSISPSTVISSPYVCPCP